MIYTFFFFLRNTKKIIVLYVECLYYMQKNMKKKNLLTLAFIGHSVTLLMIQVYIPTERRRGTKVCPDTQLDTILNHVLRQICKKDKYINITVLGAVTTKHAFFRKEALASVNLLLALMVSWLRM